MSGCCHDMSSVSRLSAVTRVYCDKTTARGFTVKQLRVSNISTLSLKTELEGILLEWGFKLRWDGFRLRDAIFGK